MEIVTIAVNVPSRSGPNKQFRPERILWQALTLCGGKKLEIALTGVDGVEQSILHTLTCLVPTVTRFVPTQAI